MDDTSSGGSTRHGKRGGATSHEALREERDDAIQHNLLEQGQVAQNRLEQVDLERCVKQEGGVEASIVMLCRNEGDLQVR